MVDLAALAPALPDTMPQLAPQQAPTTTLSDFLQTATVSAPTLANSAPSLTVAAAQTQDPAGTAQALGAAHELNAHQNAAKQLHKTHGRGFWGSLWHDISHYGGDVLHALNAPLQDVQHLYRYIRQVYVRHGIWAGLEETLGVAAGAAAGFLVAGPTGAFMGADLAGNLEALGGSGAYGGTWRQTGRPNFTIDGKLVSPGRDLANLLGHIPGLESLQDTNKGIGKVVSGVGDLGFDFGFDPLIGLGKIQQARKAAFGLDLSAKANAGLQLNRAQRFTQVVQRAIGVDDFIGRLAPGLTISDARQVDRAWSAYGSYRGALRHMAGVINKADTPEEATGAVVSLYPELGGAAAHDLTRAARGASEPTRALHDTIRDWTFNADMLRQLQGAALPSRSLSRVPLSLAERIRGLTDSSRAAELPLVFGLKAATPQRVDEVARNFAAQDGKAWTDTAPADITEYRARAVQFLSGKAPGLAGWASATPSASSGGILSSQLRLRDVLASKAHGFGSLQAGAAFRPYALSDIKQDVGNLAQSVRQGNLTAIPGQFISTIAPKQLLRAVNRKVRTFTGYNAWTVDPATRNLSYTFDPTNAKAAQGIYRAMRYAMSEKSARQWTGQMVAAARANDTAMAKSIWGQAQIEILKAAGLPDDMDLVNFLSARGHALAQGDSSAVTYGLGHNLGDGVNGYQIHDGDVTTRSALYGWQRGQFTFPNFMALKRATRQMSAYTRLYGKVDDFAAKYYTRSFFKPLALLTGGFGLRVAMAEAIPGIFRYGPLSYLRAFAADTAAKRGERLVRSTTPDLAEDAHIVAAAAAGAGGLNKFLKLSDADRELAVRLNMENDGHMIDGTAVAGHSGVAYGLDDDPNQRAQQIQDLIVKRPQGRKVPSGRFRAFHSGEDDFADVYFAGLSRRTNEPSAQHIASDALAAYKSKPLSKLPEAERQDRAWTIAEKRERQRVQGVDPKTGLAYAQSGATDPYGFERTVLQRYRDQTSEEFASHRTDDMRNYLTGADGTFHQDLTEQLANGEKPTLAQVDAIPVAKRPANVAGEVLEPWVGGTAMQRVATTGFKRVIDPVINYLSRKPLYFNTVREEYRSLLPAIRDKVVDEDTALRIAQTRAAYSILPQIHNPALRTQFAQLVQNFMPFYFAQEQAFKRVGHLILKNPAGFRQYQLTQQALNDPGFVHKDGQGNRYLVLPLVGEWGNSVIGAMAGLGMPVKAGLPLTFEGDMQSLQTVIPEVRPPGISPLGAVPLNRLSAMDPALTSLAKNVLGERGFNTDTLQTVIPNTPLRNVVKAFIGSEGDRSIANAMMSAAAAAYYHGQFPAPNAPANVRRAFIDRLKNNARSILMMKAVVSFFSPLTPEAVPEDFGLRDEFYKLVHQKGDYQTALSAFLKEHGNRAVSYTIARSDNTWGAHIPASRQAIGFINSHEQLIAEHPDAMAFMVPQDESGKQDIQTLNAELLRMHLSEHLTPEQFVAGIYRQTGINRYFDAVKVYDKARQQNAQDPQYLQTLASSWHDYHNAFVASEPDAADYLFSQNRVNSAARTYVDIVRLFASGKAPANSQAQGVRTLVDAYQTHVAALAAIGDSRRGTASRTSEDDAFQKYLDDTAQSQPNLSGVINTVFRQLQYLGNQGITVGG